MCFITYFASITIYELFNSKLFFFRSILVSLFSVLFMFRFRFDLRRGKKESNQVVSNRGRPYHFLELIIHAYTLYLLLFICKTNNYCCRLEALWLQHMYCVFQSTRKLTETSDQNSRHRSRKKVDTELICNTGLLQ